MKLKKYNINNYMYIQITEAGWLHLQNTVGEEYIQHCIKTPSYEKIIEEATWYRLQCWQVFDLFPPKFGGKSLFETNVMFEEPELKD